jgi:hypothetical protein
VVFHPFRVKGEDDSDEDPAAWRWVRSQDNWPDLVEFSPHFHLVAFGFLTDAPAIEKKTKYKGGPGWVFHLIRDLEDQADVQLLNLYLLSHTADDVDNPAASDKREGSMVVVTWWGCLSPSYLHCIESSTEDPVTCPVCGAPHVYYDHVIQEWFDSPRTSWEDTGIPVIKYRVIRKFVIVKPDARSHRKGPPPDLPPPGPWVKEEVPPWMQEYVLNVPVERVLS